MNVPVLVENAPAAPPTHFWPNEPVAVRDHWLKDDHEEVEPGFTHGFCSNWTSSSRIETIEYLSRILIDASVSSSNTSTGNLFSALIKAEKHSASVSVTDCRKNIFELRRLTGFTWDKLADLLNVDRRTISNWIKGSEVRSKNAAHIAETLALLRYIDRGSAKENAAALSERPSDITVFAAVKAGRYDEVQDILGVGRPRLETGLNKSDWIGEFQPMVMHESADGSEVSEPLPDEPKPLSRRRTIKRA